MVEKTITIAIDANIQKFRKALEKTKSDVRDATKKMKAEVEKASESVEKAAGKGGFRAFAESVKGISPTFDNVAGSISEMGDRMKKAGKAGKLAMAGVKIAVGGLALGIITLLGKAIMDVTGKFARMSDPVRFDKNTSKMKESIRKLKTSIGELASPVFEWMAKGVSLLADGLTWVVEKIAQFVGFLQGLLGIGHKVNQTLKGTADEMEEAGASANAGLAAFDKLNTLNVGEMGSMDQAERMSKLMADMRKAGEDFRKKLGETFKPLTEVFDKIKGVLTMSPSEMWEAFSQAAHNAWESIKTWASDTWTSIKDWASGLWSGFVEWGSGAWESIKETASGIWNTLSEVVSGFWESVKAWASGAWETIKGVAFGVWDSIKTFVMGIWTTITETVKGAWTAVKDFILGAFQAVGEKIKGIFTGVVDAFKYAWDKVFGAIKGAIQWILDKIEWVMGKINGMKNAVSNAYQGAKDWVGGKIEGVKNVLGFAKGGLFRPNSPQLVMMGDNKSEPEVAAPKSLIKEAVREVMGEIGGYGGSRSMNVTLEIDGKTLARHTFDDIQAEGRRRGIGAI